jgi:hypothetical protein
MIITTYAARIKDFVFEEREALFLVSAIFIAKKAYFQRYSIFFLIDLFGKKCHASTC